MLLVTRRIAFVVHNEVNVFAPPVLRGKGAPALGIHRSGPRYLRITSAQVLALKNGDVYQFAAQMEAARQRKEEAKEAIFHHRQQHWC